MHLFLIPQYIIADSKISNKKAYIIDHLKINKAYSSRKAENYENTILPVVNAMMLLPSKSTTIYIFVPSDH